MARIIVDVNTFSKEETKKIQERIYRIVQYHIAEIRVVDYSVAFQFHENCPYANCSAGICSHSLNATVNFMDLEKEDTKKIELKSIEEDKWIEADRDDYVNNFNRNMSEKTFDIFINSDKYTFYKKNIMGHYFGTDNENKNVLYCIPINSDDTYDTEDIGEVEVWYKGEEKHYKEINNVLGTNFKLTKYNLAE